MIDKGYTLIEVMTVLFIISGITALTAPSVLLKLEEFDLQKTIQMAKTNADIADEYRRRPTNTIRNADNSVTYTYGFVYPVEITAAQFNANTGANLFTTSPFGTPFRVTTNNFTSNSFVDVPLFNITPIGTDARAVPGGTEISVHSDVPDDESQNKRIKWKKRVLYLEPAR